jgi:hypothetical protein
MIDHIAIVDPCIYVVMLVVNIMPWPRRRTELDWHCLLMPSIGIEVMILPANIPADEVLEKNLTLRSLGEGRSLPLSTKVEASSSLG